MSSMILAQIGEEGIKRTVDYASVQNLQWWLAAGIFALGAVAIFLLRLYLNDSNAMKQELREITAAYLKDLKDTSSQLASTLQNSTNVVATNTTALRENTDAARELIRAGIAAAMASDALKAEIKMRTEMSEMYLKWRAHVAEDGDQRMKGNT